MHQNTLVCFQDCVICCDSLKSSGLGGDSGAVGDPVLTLSKCDHMFHQSCLAAMYDSGTKVKRFCSIRSFSHSAVRNVKTLEFVGGHPSQTLQVFLIFSNVCQRAGNPDRTESTRSHAPDAQPRFHSWLPRFRLEACSARRAKLSTACGGETARMA